MDRNKLFSATGLPAPFSLRIVEKTPTSKTGNATDRAKKIG